jgi:chromosome segregation ATPase
MTNLEPLEAELGEARAARESLLAERAGISAGFSRVGAAEDFDGEELLRLERRADELPKLITATEAKVVSLRIKIAKAGLPDLRAAEEEAERTFEAERKRFEKARAAFDAARSSLGVASGGRQTVQAQIAEWERQRFDLVSELRQPPAPVVRSRIHSHF